MALHVLGLWGPLSIVLLSNKAAWWHRLHSRVKNSLQIHHKKSMFSVYISCLAVYIGCNVNSFLSLPFTNWLTDLNFFVLNVWTLFASFGKWIFYLEKSLLRYFFEVSIFFRNPGFFYCFFYSSRQQKNTVK